MKKQKYPKGVRYYDSLTDDFQSCKRPKKIDKSYEYINNGVIYRALSFILYRFVATPIGFIHAKAALRARTVGRRRLRGKRGYILVLNHTETVGDAFAPSLTAFPARVHVVVHPDNVSLPVLGALTPMLGALPVPSDLGGARNLSLAVERRLSEGGVVAVYPEAHVWDKHTSLRPFDVGAFDFSVRNGAPVYSATRVYRRHRIFGYVTRIYIDGPFYPDATLSRSEAARRLCDEVREKMSERCLLNDINIIEYRKKNDD